MKQKVKDNLFGLIGVAIGAIGGYLYYAHIGCNSGSCPITSTPLMSILWGGAMGGVLLSMFDKKAKKQ